MKLIQKGDKLIDVKGVEVEVLHTSKGKACIVDKDGVMSIIDTIYEKVDKLSTEYSKGDTYQYVRNMWVSGINVCIWRNGIECYATTEEGAIILRDEVLNRLKL